jgi:tellurite resistance protein
VSSAAFVIFSAMWMYLAFGFGVLIAFNVLVVAVMAVAARHAEPREELRPDERARIITYVR